MTGSGSGAPGRDGTWAAASVWGTGLAMAIVMAIGLIVRLIMAYGIDGLRGSGFETDLGLFRYWATELAANGPLGFYDRGFYADYVPGYLYVLWLIGALGQALGGVGDLIKLPAIFTDVLLGFVVYRMARDLGVTPRRATLAGAVVIANPITWFDSVIWGQVDSFGVVFLLLAIRELWKGRSERAAILAVVAGLIKPQLAILVPIVALVVIRRALWPAGGWGSEPPPAPSGTGWERRTAGPVRILTTGVAGFVTAVVMAAPFGLSVVSFTATAPFVDSSLVRLILGTAASYSYLTVNAYNAWALFVVDGLSLAADGLWLPDVPVAGGAAFGAIAGIPAAAIGAFLLLSIALVTSLLVARRPDRLTILVGTCVLALAFFAVPTRVHERYLFPLFGLAGILIAFSWRWRIAYAVASIATFLNMYVVLTTLYPDNPSISDWLGIGPSIRSWGWVAVIAVAHTVVLLWGIAQLRPGARRALEAELDHGRTPEPGGIAEGPPVPIPTAPPAQAAPEPADAGRVPGEPLVAPGSSPPSAPATWPAPAPPSLSAPAPLAAEAPSPTPPARRRVPAWYDRPALSGLGPIGWLRDRMSETPIRPDRSRELAREGRGRIDRLDLFLVLLIVIAALGLRTFRVAEPARMHFDEVYHARTAAEFLQSWRYGISQSIYEWTHPHLAKYAMAGGIVLFAGHDARATGDLGVTVRDAVIEPRRENADSVSARDGDRAWVVTGDELVGFDLETRDVAARWSVPGASAVAFDPDGVSLLVGTESGEILVLDTASLDVLRGPPADAPPADPVPIAALDGAIERLVTFDAGQRVAALLPGGQVAVLDVGLGTEVGRLEVPGAADMADAGAGDAIVATTADVTDPAAAAAELAVILGGEAPAYEAELRNLDLDTVVIAGELTEDVRTEIEAAIEDGLLPGIAIGTVSQVAVAGSDGVSFLTADGTLAARTPLAGGASGLALVSGVDDGTQLWATTTADPGGKPQVSIIAVSGDQADAGPDPIATIPLPGAGTRIVFDAAAELVEVLGTTPDGTGTTVYVIEPHGRSVFADHRLPFAPAAIALDHEEAYPSSSRGELLAFGDGGEVASVDVGHYPLAWRIPGVLFGALTAGVIYLLARVLFRRRDVAVLAGLFALLDGMLFVQSRIAMNDVYTGFFILAAYLLFAWLWLQPRRWWAFWALMPALGVLLGLALASKWVAAYAIGALGILVLARSALGRVVVIAGLIGLTAVLGWMAMAVPPDSGSVGNLAFALIMISLTLGAVVVSVHHPVEWSAEEMWFAVAAPAALGILVFLAAVALGWGDRSLPLVPLDVTPFTVAFVLLAASAVIYVAFAVAGRLGFGPMAPAPAPGDARYGIPPASPPADGWLRLGAGYGLPALWLGAALLAVPLVVYVASYLPWAFVDNHQLVEGWPAGNSGQTLVGLTGDMYRYHNNLTAAHAASSPWWAWPLNLKPVWFYQGSFANDTAGAIYDAGNTVIWWLGIPAMAFLAYQAFRRRSVSLALILVAFLAQWVSWARIDRASFQYHYYTSLPFVIVGLAYFVAELWHGASRRTWRLARIAAAVAVMGPALLWLLRLPLCALANVASVNEGSAACQLSTPPTSAPMFILPSLIPEVPALVVFGLLLLPALLVLTARDARRFVGGLVAAAAIYFAVLYPNISALPLPSAFVNAYQILLPTYPYAFQFSVNTVERGAVSFADARFLVLAAFLVVAAAVVAYSTWAWRASLAADGADGSPGGTSSAPGGPAGTPDAA